MEEHKIEFLPFHAINDFMRPDFRLSVIRATLSAFPNLPKNLQEPIQRLTHKLVKVPGFRSSEKSPSLVRVIPTSKVFEDSPEMVAAVLSAWVEAYSELRAQVYEVLRARGWLLFPAEMHSVTDLPSLKTEHDWGILPPAADRTRLPGFLIYWPKGQDFETLYRTFSEMYPQAEASLDQVSLMAVWLSMRLPYHIVGLEGEEEPTHDTGEADEETEEA